MDIPITVIASTRPSPALLQHTQQSGTAVIATRHAITQIGLTEMLIAGRVTASEPDTYFRSPGCPCCASREDLVHSVVRTVRHTNRPERLLVVVDPDVDDLLTVISTLLSSFEISRECSLDGVILHLDAVEMATRLATGESVINVALEPAVAIADIVVVDGPDQVTDSALASMSDALRERAGFARFVFGPSGGLTSRLDAWHGAPAAIAVEPDRVGNPSTVVLRVGTPLDAQAIDEWLELLVARHATRLFRLQGALSVAGNDERTCCFGVRSFAVSHSEGEHAVHRSTESVIALCGIDLDADELASSFESTVAS